MDTYTLENAAYATANAYKNTRTSTEAIARVVAQHPGLIEIDVEKMWHAIDAYVDLFGD